MPRSHNLVVRWPWEPVSARISRFKSGSWRHLNLAGLYVAPRDAKRNDKIHSCFQQMSASWQLLLVWLGEELAWSSTAIILTILQRVFSSEFNTSNWLNDLISGSARHPFCTLTRSTTKFVHTFSRCQQADSFSSYDSERHSLEARPQ